MYINSSHDGVVWLMNMMTLKHVTQPLRDELRELKKEIEELQAKDVADALDNLVVSRSEENEPQALIEVARWMVT